MSNERLFEVGDLVTGHTIYRPEIKTIATITKVFNGEIAVKMDDSDFILQNNEFIVNYIRKPRKGSKEARDIVAMLKREYKNARYVTGDTDISGVLAEKAKSMLK